MSNKVNEEELVKPKPTAPCHSEVVMSGDSTESADQRVCLQCEANARHNEVAGYMALGAECRAYCLRGHKLTQYKVGDRLRNIRAGYLPIVTVTELTERGFKYTLDKPIVISPRLGTQVGGESYSDSHWELVAEQPSTSDVFENSNLEISVQAVKLSPDSFFASRIRNQASNIIRTVFGPQNYPAQSAKGELEDLITIALLAAHASTQPENDRRITTEESHSPASLPESSESDIQLILAEIRERSRVAEFAFEGQEAPPAQRDIRTLLSIIDSRTDLDTAKLREQSKRAAEKIISEFAGILLVPSRYTLQMFYGKRFTDIIFTELNTKDT